MYNLWFKNNVKILQHEEKLIYTCNSKIVELKTKCKIYLDSHVREHL